MTGIVKLAGGAAFIAIALLLHTFYIDYQYGNDNFIVSWKASQEDYESFIDKKSKAVTWGDPRQVAGLLRQEYPFIQKGMVPSVITAGRRPSNQAFINSMWFGVVFPIAFMAIAVTLLTWAFRPRHETSNSDGIAVRLENEGGAGSCAEAVQKLAKNSLSGLLKQHFGPELAVGEGTAKKHDPLIITELVDYVSIEYAISKYLMQGLEFKLDKQRLLRIDGKKIDELAFYTRDRGAAEWQSTRRFYFDITAGFDHQRLKV